MINNVDRFLARLFLHKEKSQISFDSTQRENLPNMF